MLALRYCAFAVLCSHAVGCFLDETPATGRLGHAATGGMRASRSGFVPREPDRSTSRPDAETTDANTAQPSASPPIARVDSPMQAATPTGVSRVATDAGKPDAQVARDAAMSPMIDAQIAPTGPTTPFVGTPPRPVHRYEFSGRGRVAIDSIADADGELLGSTSLDGSGAVQLDGSAENAVTLPSGVLSGLSAFTVIGWLELRSDECWQHFVDFTYSYEQPAQDGSGRTITRMSALYLTPRGCPEGFPIAGYVTEQGRVRVTSDEEVVWSRRFMLGMMYESTTRTLSVIVDGVVQQQATVPLNLRELARARGTLGRSYYPDDPTLNGSINELRIYAGALDGATLAEIARRGPDQL